MPVILGTSSFGDRYPVPFGAIPAGLVLTDRGGGNPVIVDHWGAKVSWDVRGPGTLSAFLTAAEARALGASGANWAGAKWAYYLHPSLPAWGGVGSQPRWSGDGTFELAADSFHVLMRRRRVPRTYGQQSAPAGALAQRAFRDCQADDYLFIRDFQADEDGANIEWEWRGGDLVDDVFRELAGTSNQEWGVDADRNAEWRVRLGQDKTARVVLSFPHEVVAFDYGGDLWTVVNDLEAVAADQRYERSAHEFLAHHDSVKAIGRYQETARVPGVVNKATIRPWLRQAVHKTAWPAETMRLTTLNVGRSWESYHIGDSVSVILPTADALREVRILARSIDVDAGTEQLAADVEHEADGW